MQSAVYTEHRYEHRRNTYRTERYRYTDRAAEEYPSRQSRVLTVHMHSGDTRTDQVIIHFWLEEQKNAEKED
eukprot:3937986-Rhodomonas_salina.1